MAHKVGREGGWKMGREPMAGGHSPLPSKSRAGLWAHLQPPGLSAPARILCFRAGGGGALGGKLELCCPLAAFSGNTIPSTGKSL